MRSATTAATFNVTLDMPSKDAITVHAQTTDDTAKAPDDYASAEADLHFAAGTTKQTLSVTVNGDTPFETDEQFFIDLSKPTNATIATDSKGTADRCVGLIKNDDSAPTVSNADVALDEGNSGTQTAHFVIPDWVKEGDPEAEYADIKRA